MPLLYHRGGPVPCGGPALAVAALPSRYELTADNVRKLDGTRPQRGEAVLCGTCGQPVHAQWLYAAPDRVVMALCQ